jgi:histidinol-phosphate aminotransferase
VADRRATNAAAIARLSGGLRDRGYPIADSQTNFVYADFGPEAASINERLLEQGVIVRPVFPAEWFRISAGSDAEIDRFFAALDAVTG